MALLLGLAWLGMTRVVVVVVVVVMVMVALVVALVVVMVVAIPLLLRLLGQRQRWRHPRVGSPQGLQRQGGHLASPGLPACMARVRMESQT